MKICELTNVDFSLRHFLLPLMRGGTRPAPTLGWEHEGNRALRQGKWKLVSRHKQPWELFDMEADRTEQRDLAAADPEEAVLLAERIRTRLGWTPRHDNLEEIVRQAMDWERRLHNMKIG